ncbi:MAG: hypothetical protein V4441_13000 [Pseudomonadota bacterium]
MIKARGVDAESFSAAMMPVPCGFSDDEDPHGTNGFEGAKSVIGVLIVIGAIILAAMFFVLYVRAIAAEKRADVLSNEIAMLRDELDKRR